MVSATAVSRRDVCKMTLSAVALARGGGAQAVQGEDTIVRSNRFLTIGLNRKTGRAFIEEKSSGETWVWDWRQIRVADRRSFSDDRAGLSTLQPNSITSTSDGFALNFQESWGRFRCSVELDATDVLFRVEPDVCYPCALGAVKFPPTLRPESGTRPV